MSKAQRRSIVVVALILVGWVACYAVSTPAPAPSPTPNAARQAAPAAPQAPAAALDNSRETPAVPLEEPAAPETSSASERQVASEAARRRSNAELADSVARHEFTWTFDRKYPTGRYANGDPWVVGPVTIVKIVPPSSEREGRVMHGSVVNPRPGPKTQGYDSAMYGKYGPDFDAKMNVGLGVSPAKPLILKPGSSLISTLSDEEPGARPQLLSAGILTVIDEPVPEGTFRPPYAGKDKTHRFSTRDIDWSKLKSLPPPKSAPSFREAEKWFDRPWLDHIGNWTGRYAHPSRAMPAYGRDLATLLGDGALLLHLEGTRAQKKEVLYDYLQIGIDLAGIVEAGGTKNWIPAGGHTQGRKWPILFAGLVLGDPGMIAIGKSDAFFGEDGQTFYVKETSPGVYNDGHGGYTAADEGLPEWGIRHSTHPAQDNRSWGATYRVCCTTSSWVGHVLAALIMDARDEWNHAALFDYTDRFMDKERALSPFTQDMWEKYRRRYGDVWSP